MMNIRIIVGVLSATLIISSFPKVQIWSEEKDKIVKYPYTLYAEDEELGIEINTENLTVNGDIYTNGSFKITAKYPCVSGKL